MFERIINYFKDARIEFRKVSWPTRRQTIRSTLAVILMSLGVAAFLGGLDFIFQYVVQNFVL